MKINEVTIEDAAMSGFITLKSMNKKSVNMRVEMPYLMFSMINKIEEFQIIDVPQHPRDHTWQFVESLVHASLQISIGWLQFNGKAEAL
jgi:hypothetical protein